MERVDAPALGDGLLGGRERLADDLAAEDPAPAEVLAVTAEDVLLDALELEDRHQLVDEVLLRGHVVLGHGSLLGRPRVGRGASP